MTDTINKKLRIAVGVASSGRPDVLSAMIGDLNLQSCKPDRIIISCATEQDAGDVHLRDDVHLIKGKRGLTEHRNAIIQEAADCDILVFFDDDFFAERNYLAVVERLFTDRDDVVMMTGEVRADGKLGPGLSIADARRIISAIPPSEPDLGAEVDIFNGYGCNMAFRLKPVIEHDIRFDEDLPLYGWLEDVDFSRLLAGYGRILRVSGAQGVHLGIKKGRQSGIRLGYSQIANPLYLLDKNTYSWRLAAYMMTRNVTANSLRTFWPEHYIDRRGRLAGNFKALVDLLRGRLHPTRILNM